MSNFRDIERRLGHVAAYSCLLEIEKAANINYVDVIGVDLEARFENACRVLDETNFHDTAQNLLEQEAG